jgi:ATP-dependent DNA helicase DinG
MFHVVEDYEEGSWREHDDDTHAVDQAVNHHPPLAPRMAHAFSPEGKMAASPQYEYRPQQQRMAELVGETLEKNRALVCEAATGVGKSLAYLVPAVTFALEQKRKAIICTHTINLQEQLISKDIPIVKQLVGNSKAEPTTSAPHVSSVP